MKKIIQFVAVFLAGALTAGLLSWLWLLRPANDAIAGLYASEICNMDGTALQIARGDAKGALQAIEVALPPYVMALHNMGRNEQTVQALRVVKDYYNQSGRSVPPQIAEALSSL